MTSSRHRFLLHGLRATAMIYAAVAAADASAGEDHAASLTVGEPAGFSTLAAPRKLVVDVYSGGQRVGETQVLVAPGLITFVDPVGVVDMMPSLKDGAAFRALLASEALPSNGHLVCTEHADKTKCGRLTPEVAGVIFDSEHFRIDFFVNPQFVSISQVEGLSYLSAPDPSLGIVNSIAAVVAGSSDASFYSFQNRLIVGQSNKRLRADVSYSDGLGFNAEQIALEVDRPELRYSAGAMWAPGLALIGRRKLIGVGIETQIDTRLDKDTAIGTPVIVYLAQRGRIDALVEGRVVSSRIYDAGNQQIDTSQFPDGSYEVALRIEEVGLSYRQERRFFTKSRRIPPAGSPTFFGIGGLLIDQPLRESLDPSQTFYVQGGVAQRIGERVAIDGSIEILGDAVRGEVGFNVFTPFAWLRATAVGSADGGYGGLVQVSSAGNSTINFNFDLRRVELGEPDAFEVPIFSIASDQQGIFGDPFPIPNLDGFTQISGTVSYSLSGTRFLTSASYRRSADGDSTYTVGPSVEWDFLRRGPMIFTAHGNLTLTERGEVGFLGISLRLLGARASMGASLGGRASSFTDDGLESGLVATVGGAWNDPAFAGGELSIGAGFERDPERDSFFASGELRRPTGSFAADVVHSNNGGDSATQYSLGLQTTVGVRGGDIVLDGRSTSESLVTAQIVGARPTDRFELLVDEQTKGTLLEGEKIVLSLPSYRHYDLRIRPLTGGLISYDGSTRRVALYPGNVAALAWSARPVQIFIGSLRYPDGRPVANASLTAEAGWSQTDENGAFQIETTARAAIEVVTAEGEIFRTRLPEGENRAEFANLGMIVCCETEGASLARMSEAPVTTARDPVQ